MSKPNAKKTVGNTWTSGGRKPLVVVHHGAAKNCLRLRVPNDEDTSIVVTLDRGRSDKFLKALLHRTGYEHGGAHVWRVPFLEKAAVDVVGDQKESVVRVFQQGNHPLWVFSEARLSRKKTEELVQWLAPLLGWELHEAAA